MTLSMCRSQSHMSGMCLATSPEHNHLTAMFLPSQSDLETMFLPSHSDHNAMPSPSTCHLKWMISDVSFRCQQNSRNDVQTMSKRCPNDQNIINTSSKHHLDIVSVVGEFQNIINTSSQTSSKHHLEIVLVFGEFQNIIKTSSQTSSRDRFVFLVNFTNDQTTISKRCSNHVSAIKSDGFI